MSNHVLFRPVSSVGTGGFSPSNNLQEFVDFVSEKVVKAKVVGMKIRTHIPSRQLSESIKDTISFDVMQRK